MEEEEEEKEAKEEEAEAEEALLRLIICDCTATKGADAVMKSTHLARRCCTILLLECCPKQHSCKNQVEKGGDDGGGEAKGEGGRTHRSLLCATSNVL